MPTLSGGDDQFRVSGPAEGAWVRVGVREEAVDGFLEGAQGVEHTTPQPPLASLAKKPSTALSQDADVRVTGKTKRVCRFSQRTRFPGPAAALADPGAPVTARDVQFA